MQIYEMTIEETVIDLLQKEGYELIADDDFWVVNRKLSDFINDELLLSQLKKINKNVKEELLIETIATIKRIDHPSLFVRNKQFHKMLVDGITVEDNKSDINPLIKLIDFENIDNNKFQVAHQIKFKEYHDTRIPDILIFVNGLPLIVMELKGFEDTLIDTDLEFAYNQLGANTEGSGYRYDIPTLFNYNVFEVISDGTTAKVGTLTSKIDRFNEWKSKNGEPGYDADCAYKIDVLVEGLFKKNHLIDVIKNGIFFLNKGKQKPIKIMCQYHQYFGVIKSLNSVKKALRPNGDGKAGIVWHTQGSGKSFSMVMLAHRLMTNKELNTPTIVILTDRIDLDDQLYSTFAQSEEYLRCQPIRVESRKDLLDKLSTIKQGGVILTTVGKFDKEDIRPNDRNNIIVMADEAHRGHYGIYEKVTYERNDNNELEMVIKYGTEKYIRESLPNATFIGFTGTPITTEDKSTTDIYGEIIDTYDMSQSVNDGATVRIFYEGRLAKIWTDPNILLQIDEYYDALEETNQATKEAIDKSKKAMSSLKKILEDDDVIELLAKDIIDHYEGRKNFLNGKAMIVVASRIVAFKLYNVIIKLRPEWKEMIAPIVTESNKDTQEMRELFKNSDYRKEVGEEFKREDSKLKIAIVVDMWLTGFDVPDLDVMYLFKKMKGHNLMQAIARVNRVYPGKDSGLIVDYIGLAKALDQALDTYTARDKEFNIKDIQDTAKKILMDKLSILNELFNKNKVEMAGFYSTDSPKRFKAIQNGAQFILSNENQKNEFLTITLELKRAFIVSAGILSKDERENVQYYLSVRSFILKLSVGKSD
ncbi:MAG: type I restriction endonuclease subunit R, partial [Acholeplasmatales bacterium]|nr:type I restriction endonuclease subunit R [Acholeplasmatales bacterium]